MLALYVFSHENCNTLNPCSTSVRSSPITMLVAIGLGSIARPLLIESRKVTLKDQVWNGSSVTNPTIGWKSWKSECDERLIHLCPSSKWGIACLFCTLNKDQTNVLGSWCSHSIISWFVWHLIVCYLSVSCRGRQLNVLYLCPISLGFLQEWVECSPKPWFFNYSFTKGSTFWPWREL